MANDWDRILETFHRPWKIKRHANDYREAIAKSRSGNEALLDRFLCDDLLAASRHGKAAKDRSAHGPEHKQGPGPHGGADSGPHCLGLAIGLVRHHGPSAR
jgi:hypothetical protein